MMEIYVYADWTKSTDPILVGTLRSSEIRGKEHFSFSYDKTWLTSDYIRQIDPSLKLFVGEQHAQDDKNFKTFLDSCPDRWGRLLMQRREAAVARQENRRAKNLYETDYLLDVHDSFRMGALRFCTSPTGPFLDDSHKLAAPAITSLPELQHAANKIEETPDLDNPDYLKWLNMLISPGSSLGGARPKASIRNHGFILESAGWRLSPAYDINPMLYAAGLRLNIDDASNELSTDLALDVAEYFHVTESKAKAIHQRLLKAVSQWESLAQQAGIRKEERELLRDCFILN